MAPGKSQIRLTRAVVPGAQGAQKRLEVGRSSASPAQGHAVARGHVERAKEHALIVFAADGHRGLVAARRPRRAQGRQQAQGGLVLRQEHGARRPRLQAAHERPFFWARCGSLAAKT